MSPRQPSAEPRLRSAACACRVPRAAFRRGQRQSRESKDYVSHWIIFAILASAYLDIGQIATLHRRHASALVKLDLPDATKIREKVLDALASVDVPHLDSLFAARDDLATVVLKASYGPRVGSQLALAFPILRIPDSESAIGGSGHETVVAKIQQTDQQGVAHEGVQTGARIEIPNLDQRVHRP